MFGGLDKRERHSAVRVTVRGVRDFAVLGWMTAIWRATRNKTANFYVIKIAM